MFHRLKKLFALQGKYRILHLFGLILTLLYSLSNILSPLLSRYLIDTIIPSRNYHMLLLGMIYFCIGMLVLPILGIWKDLIYSYISEKLLLKLRLALMQKIVESKLSFTRKTRKGDVVNRIMDDSGFVSNLFATFFSNLLLNTLTILIIIFTMALTSPLITLFVIILMLISLILNLWYSKGMKKLFSNRQKNMDSVTSAIIQLITGIETVKTFNLEKFILNKSESLFSNLFETNYLIRKTTTLFTHLNYIFVILSIAIVYGFGSMQIFKGNLTLGEIVSLGLFFQLLQNPISEIFQSNLNIKKAIPVLDRLFEYLELPSEELSCFNKTTNLESLFTLRNFNYLGNDGYILRDINLQLPKKGLVLFSGVSGSGKSTLLKSILCLYDKLEGNLSLSSCFRNDSVFGIRNSIGYVSQEAHLFNMSIRDNIILDQVYDISKLYSVCNSLNMHHRIMDLADGYDYILSEDSILSGGEKQRLCIARALYKDAEAYFFDEAASALDPENENSFINIVLEIAKRKLVVIISHNRDYIKMSDKYYIFCNGAITEHIQKNDFSVDSVKNLSSLT